MFFKGETMTKFKIYWNDGRNDELEGKDLPDALKKAGYRTESINDVRRFESLTDNQTKAVVHFSDKEKTLQGMLRC